MIYFLDNWKRVLLPYNNAADQLKLVMFCDILYPLYTVRLVVMLHVFIVAGMIGWCVDLNTQKCFGRLEVSKQPKQAKRV